ncbi:MAG: hypothetical protein ACUVTZ_07380 [Armatimonadota bacterium]
MVRRLLAFAGVLIIAAGPACGEPAADADRAEALYKSAVRHLTSGRWYARSVRLLEEAKALDPSKPAYREALGCAYLAQALDLLLITQPRNGGDPKPALRPFVEKAIAEAEAAVEASPTTAEYHHTLGWIRLAAAREGLTANPKAEAQKAEEHFREAIRLSPRSARYHRSLADLYRLVPSARTNADDSARSALEDDPAAAEYRAAVRLDPRDAGLHYILSSCEARRPDSQGVLAALEEISSAARLDPTNALPQYLRADLLFRLAEGKSGEDQQSATAEAVQAIISGNRLPDLRLNLYIPAFPKCLAVVLTRLLQETDFDTDLPLYESLKSAARRAISYAGELEGAGDVPGAAGILENVIVMGERISAEAYLRGAPTGRDMVQFSTGLAIQQEALRPLTDIVMRHGTPQHAFLVQQKQQELTYLAQLLRGSPLMRAPSTSEAEESAGQP